jgi:L-threonylcarbamoyladenylate synthase
MDARVDPIERIADACARVIFAGGTIVFPTDTGAAIACDPLHSATVDRIYVLCGYPDDKPLTMFLASPAEFLEYARGNPLAVLASKRVLPGPVTLLVRRPGFISDELNAGLPALGLRVPDEPVARAILERVGPLVGTGVEADAKIASDLTIENGAARYDRESSIVDLTHQPARLVREGAVSYERLTERLGPIERQTVKVRSQS